MKLFYEITRILDSSAIDAEFKYFSKYARRFDSNSKEERYGILKINTEPKDENMLYAPNPKELRLLHLNHVAENGLNNGHKTKIFLEKLEKLEGKKA